MNSIKDELATIGFEKIGQWKIDKNDIRPEFDPPNHGAIDIENALYAFVVGEDEDVKYIGKTTRSIRKRFRGYSNPYSKTATNGRCNKYIRDCICDGHTVEIWVFAPTIPFQVSGYDVNLAAGLEDSLILKLKPDWNGGRSELASAEIDLEEIDKKKNDSDNYLDSDASNSTQQVDFNNPCCRFDIKLNATYFNTGSINPGVSASKCLGDNGELVRIFLGSEKPDSCVNSTINRTANPNGSVRVRGNNSKIAEWFQARFKLGDNVEASVLDRNTIFLKSARS